MTHALSWAGESNGVTIPSWERSMNGPLSQTTTQPGPALTCRGNVVSLGGGTRGIVLLGPTSRRPENQTGMFCSIPAGESQACCDLLSLRGKNPTQRQENNRDEVRTSQWAPRP